jgi:predicted nucleic acid-binding protein
MTARVVLDASVVVKWFVRDPHGEDDTRQAMAVFDVIAKGTMLPLQPPHWLAEVTAAMARLEPSTIVRTTQLLYALEWPVMNDLEMYVSAGRLAAQLHHHVFDTLYHAVARCEPGAFCITADAAYFRKARALGNLTLLRDFRLH